MMIIRRRLLRHGGLAAILTVTALAVPPPAAAEELIGNFDDWSAFSKGTGKSRICYIASVPKKETGKYKSRGNSYLLVTHRPADNTRDVVELRAGYTYKSGSEVELTMGDDRFKLFTDGGTAWARESQTDRAVARAMIKGKSLIVKGVSSRGTETVDTYSLIGFTAAYKAIGTACGVK